MVVVPVVGAVVAGATVVEAGGTLGGGTVVVVAAVVVVLPPVWAAAPFGAKPGARVERATASAAHLARLPTRRRTTPAFAAAKVPMHL